MIKETIDAQSKQIKRNVRSKAIYELDQNLIRYGKDKCDISFDEYKQLLALEEDKIWNEYKNKTVTVLGILFGIAWF